MSGQAKEFQIEPINKTLPSAGDDTRGRDKRLTLESRDQFGLREDVAFDDLFHVRIAGFWFQSSLVIECVELEKIVVCRAAQLRTRPVVTNFSGDVLALARAVGKFRFRGDALG